MAATMNTEARRPIARTYEGVQWFKEGSDHYSDTFWRCSVPGTTLSIVRWQDDMTGRPGQTPWISQVEIWTDDGLGGYWHPILTNQQGESVDTPFQLPWDLVSNPTVKHASIDAKVLRAHVAAQLQRGVGA